MVVAAILEAAVVKTAGTAAGTAAGLIRQGSVPEEQAVAQCAESLSAAAATEAPQTSSVAERSSEVLTTVAGEAGG